MSKLCNNESTESKTYQSITVGNPQIIARGRGYLLNMMKQKDTSELLTFRASPREVGKQTILNHQVRAPPRSTYIPIEPDENDESIYENGIHSGINFENFNEIKVKVSGQNAPEFVESFESCILSEVLMENIKKCKFLKPTPIQKYAFPIIFSGRDLMAAAQTGSGKTVAFVLPILQKLLMEPRELIKDNNHSEPQVVIIVPTRELAVQIKTVVLKLSRGTGISSLLCYGGTLVSHQKNKILEGCHILIATPGRLNEYVEHGFINFTSVRFFVLDEVDKMLNMESKPDIDRFFDHFSMPSVMNRQTIMLSATLPDSIQELSTFYLNKNYLFLTVGKVSCASKDIKQNIYQVNRYKKRSFLINILKQGSEGTIVFVKQKWMADFLATYLCEKNICATSIHGDRLQDQREQALDDFKTGKMNVLVATAVASRGLDIKCVNHVINYDMPEEIEEYVQQIGRTGRLGNQGIASSLFDVDRDFRLVEPIIKTLSSANQDVPYWLLKLGQEVKYNEEISNDCGQYGGSDIRINTNAVDEIEDW